MILGGERTGEVDEDGEYEVIIVDQNNSSILASSDHCPSSTTSSGPPSLKVSTAKHHLSFFCFSKGSKRKFISAPKIFF